MVGLPSPPQPAAGWQGFCQQGYLAESGWGWATPASQCCTRTEESVLGLVAPDSAKGGVAWPPIPGVQPTCGGRRFTRSTPSYGSSFIKCRGGCWKPHRLAVFVSLLCGRVWSTWQLERAGPRKSDLGLECMYGCLAEREPAAQGRA